MTLYNVLAPPAVAGSAEPDPDRLVLIKEGFCWPALYMTAIWLLWRRMWLVFVLYVVVAFCIVALVREVAVPVAWIILILFGVLVGLEANNLRRWTLERRGYRFVGVASGDRMREAEFRFFANWAGSGAAEPQPPEPAKPASPPHEQDQPKPERRAPVETGEVVGLFPKPGGLA